MLTNMLEIEFAYNLIATESIDSDKDILDNHYDNLKADIKVFSKLQIANVYFSTIGYVQS